MIPSAGASVPLELGSATSGYVDVCTNPKALWTPSVRVFMKASLHRHDWPNHWTEVIELNLQALFWEVRTESSNPLINHMVSSSGYQTSPYKSHLLSINSGLVERGLLWIAKDAPLTPITQEMPRIFGALCQEQGWRSKICISYFDIISQWLNLLQLFSSLVLRDKYVNLLLCFISSRKIQKWWAGEFPETSHHKTISHPKARTG